MADTDPDPLADKIDKIKVHLDDLAQTVEDEDDRLTECHDRTDRQAEANQDLADDLADLEAEVNDD